MLGLAIAVVILVGFMRLTQFVEDYHRSRSKIVLSSPLPPTRPFRYSETQCVDCGSDGELLDIDTHLCLGCFELMVMTRG